MARDRERRSRVACTQSERSQPAAFGIYSIKLSMFGAR
jgi:hypothetical protein